MLEQLFGSKTRLKLLRTLYREPERAYFVRELGRAVDAQINAVRREIELLCKIGIVVESEHTAKDEKKSGAKLRKYYQLNNTSIIFNELQALLLKEQLMGEQKFIEALQKKAGEVQLMVLTGVFTQTEAQTDLLIVGDIKPRVLAKLVEKFEKDFGFDIRYTCMTPTEFEERRYVMDKFIFAIFEGKHLRAVDRLGM